jgi:hypothetical protein
MQLATELRKAHPTTGVAFVTFKQHSTSKASQPCCAVVSLPSVLRTLFPTLWHRAAHAAELQIQAQHDSDQFDHAGAAAHQLEGLKYENFVLLMTGLFRGRSVLSSSRV